MGQSVYEKQKLPLTAEQDGVRGFADLKSCSKCGQGSQNLRKCAHCDQELCMGCFYEKAHFQEFNKVYDLHKETTQW
jgi:hypothetical protein